MSAYIKLQQFANEIAVLRREIKKLRENIKGVDISKYDSSSPFSVRDELGFMRNQAAHLIHITEGMQSTGISNIVPAYRDRTTYAYGRLGQLKGEMTPLIQDLGFLIRHIDLLLSGSKENNQKAKAMTLVADSADQLASDQHHSDPISSILMVASIINLLIRRFGK